MEVVLIMILVLMSAFIWKFLGNVDTLIKKSKEREDDK